MLSLLPLVFVLPFSVLSNPLPQKTYGGNPSACAQIKGALTPLPTPSANPAVFGTVPAQLAWDCVQSIPLNASAGIELVKAIRPYLGWQSTVGYLKAPPEEYVDKLFPPVDVYGGLDRITEKLKAGAYRGEYDVSFLENL